VNSGHTLFFRASTNCSKILKDKKYFNAIKNIRTNSVFQGRHKLLKNLECKNYIQHSEKFQSKLRFPGQAQVAQKSLKIKTFQYSERVQGNSVFQRNCKLFEILNDKKSVTWQNSVASIKVCGAKMFNSRRKTLFWLGYRLSKHKMTLFSKNLGGMTLLADPWLRLWPDGTRQCLPYHNHGTCKTNWGSKITNWINICLSCWKGAFIAW